MNTTRTTFDLPAGTIERLTDPRRYEPRQATSVVLCSRPGGGSDPIVGLSYLCDFKAEEEWGVGDLSAAFAMSANPNSVTALLWESSRARSAARGESSRRTRFSHPAGTTQSDLVEVLDDMVIFHTRPVTYAPSRESSIERARTHFASSGSYVRGELHNTWAVREGRKSEIIEILAERGVEANMRMTLPVLRSMVADLDEVENPDSQPGWFQTGEALILRRSFDLHGDVLDHLVQAARDGFLQVGSAGQSAFGSGLVMLDSRDLDESDVDAIIASNDWYQDRMDDLDPVMKTLRERGHSWFFLGKPSALDTGDGRKVVRYWLNGSKSPGVRNQPYGWYTIEELLAEKFVADALARQEG